MQNIILSKSLINRELQKTSSELPGLEKIVVGKKLEFSKKSLKK